MGTKAQLRFYASTFGDSAFIAPRPRRGAAMPVLAPMSFCSWPSPQPYPEACASNE
jgi:hypothetical protein